MTRPATDDDLTRSAAVTSLRSLRSGERAASITMQESRSASASYGAGTIQCPPVELAPGDTCLSRHDRLGEVPTPLKSPGKVRA
jgi:hypothetical protein